MSGRKVATFVAVSVACAASAAYLITSVRPARATPNQTSVHPAAVPAWSARRVPALLVQDVEQARRARAAEALTSRLHGIVAPEDACVAVDGPTGALARIHADTALAPASTMKLLTGTTAIDVLGPQARFRTRVVSDGSGNVFLVGGGDPLLATPAFIAGAPDRPLDHGTPFTPLSALADAIVRAGVRHVRDALVVDDHLHDTLRFLPVWKPIYGQEGDIGSLGALTVDRGFSDPATNTLAADPAVTTGLALTDLLAQRGVIVTGGVRRGRAPATAREIAHVDSSPIAAIVGEMLTNSDNYVAEELVRDIAAAHDDHVPATTAAGTALVTGEMRRLHISTAGLVMRDGSGLSHDDRVSCATMLGLIELASEPRFAAVNAGLAIAARTGTLENRFIGDSLAGRLRAKTGSISGVVGLVGIVDGSDPLHFAFLANGGFSSAAGAQLQSEVAQAVASTPDVRVPSHLVPPP